MRNPYIEQDNADALQINGALREVVRECEPHAAPYLNLGAVFFHDLMIILSGYALRLRELAGPHRPRTEAEWTPRQRLPYIDFNDAENGVDPDSNTYSILVPEVNRSRRWASAASKVLGPLVGARHTVAVASPSSLSVKRLIAALLRSRVKVVFPPYRPLAVPGLSEQFEIVTRRIEAISADLGWPGPPGQVAEVARRHIMALTVEGDPQRIGFDVLVCGPLSEQFNRILAARAMAAGGRVVVSSHGGGEGMYDEPAYGYHDRSFSTSILGFGPAGADLAEDSEFVETLYELPSYAEGNEPVVKGLAPTQEVAALTTLDGKRVVYVPTSFAGTSRYGPFRDIPDRMYLEWQETVLREFPNAIWKGHPKEIATHGFEPRGAAGVSRTRLQHRLDDADVFIFDYLATAFCFAAATTKPIIFFDIGLRNHSAAAQQAIAKRCILVTADPESTGELREQVLALSGEPCVNTFSSQFCLSSDPDSADRETIAVEMVKDLAT